MRRARGVPGVAAVAAAALAVAAPARAQAPRAFVEIVPAAVECWRHQRVGLVVRVGCDRAFFAAHAVPLLQQPLDQPFAVAVPWLDAPPPGTRVRIRPGASAAAHRIATGGRIAAWNAAAERSVDGVAFAVFELRCDVEADAVGELCLDAPVLRYAHASRFEEDFLRGRQPVDRQEAEVAGPALRLAVRDLPAPRPAGFVDAVGSFAVRAEPAVAAVAVGEPFVLRLFVEGDGNLDAFTPPPWPSLDGFLVQGLLDGGVRGAGGEGPVRMLTLDVVALRAGATAVPPISLSYFEPAAGEYRQAATAPAPIDVRPAAGELPPRLRALVAADAERLQQRSAWPAWTRWLAVAVAAIAVAFAFAARRRSRRGELLLARLDAALRAADADGARALAEFCASAFGWTTVPDSGAALARSLTAANVPEPLRDRAAATFDALAAARYGRGASPAAPDVLALAQELRRGARGAGRGS